MVSNKNFFVSYYNTFDYIFSLGKSITGTYFSSSFTPHPTLSSTHPSSPPLPSTNNSTPFPSLSVFKVHPNTAVLDWMIPLHMKDRWVVQRYNKVFTSLLGWLSVPSPTPESSRTKQNMLITSSHWTGLSLFMTYSRTPPTCWACPAGTSRTRSTWQTLSALLQVFLWLLINLTLIRDLMFFCYCQNPNLTSTQGWVWREHDFTNPTTHPQKLNISNISAVTDTIWTKL